MTRSVWKPTFIDLNTLKKIASNSSDDNIINVWSRSSTILPIFNKKSFNIYNGKNFTTLKITNDSKIGSKFGEFAPTKKRVVHKVLKTKRK